MIFGIPVTWLVSAGDVDRDPGFAAVSSGRRSFQKGRRGTLTEIRDLLGHPTVKMTERYARLAPENARVAVALLEGPASRFSHVDVGVLREVNKKTAVSG
jgi:hypothetical protein